MTRNMERVLWIIGFLLGVGLIAAVVCRHHCGECCPEEEEDADEAKKKDADVSQVEEEEATPEEDPTT